MSSLDGIFSLRTPRDLREKLESDFTRLSGAAQASAAAQYAAFDFFVTAFHLADWLRHAKGQPLASCRAYADGQLVEHIANGAKHFSVDVKRHSTVSDTAVQGFGFQPGAFQSNAFAPVQHELVVKLENGLVEPVLVIAERVLHHWRSVLP